MPDHAAVVWVHAAAGGGRSGSAYYPTLERHGGAAHRRRRGLQRQLAGRPLRERRRSASPAQLGLARTGGSDAHEAPAIMACDTEFPDPVRDTADVVTALEAASHEPVARARRSRERRLGTVRLSGAVETIAVQTSARE